MPWHRLGNVSWLVPQPFTLGIGTLLRLLLVMSLQFLQNHSSLSQSTNPYRTRSASNIDQAVVAVTVDGHLHTLDAWTGETKGVFTNSGGPLVSSSTTVNPGEGGGDRGGSGQSDGDNTSNRADGPVNFSNPLNGGLVIPGLDGVIYTLGADGRLSVLLTSAPDLVLEPRMACLTVSADLNGLVEEEGCGLLIGEKTTKLFALDTNTGEASRIGDGVPKFSTVGQGHVQGQTSGQPDWSSGHDYDSKGGSGTNHLLLQRDDYVVRALDTATSTELWNVTVGHFSALDLQGKGGASALTRSTTSYAKPQPDVEESYLTYGGYGARGALPGPGGERESMGSEDQDQGTEDGDWWGGEGGSRTRRDDAPVTRFPYLLYEDNAWVVALNPWDGSVLWRVEMPALAVAMYGIQGQEWIDIMPPPMSMLRQSEVEMAAAATLPLVSRADGSGGGVGSWNMELEEEPVAGPDRENRHPVGDGDPPAKVFTVPTGLGEGSDLEGYSGSCHITPEPPEEGSDSGDSRDESRDGGVPGKEGGEVRDRAVVPTTWRGQPTVLGLQGNRGFALGQAVGALGTRPGQIQAQLGYLNGHFFVSSSLRNLPMGSGAVGPATGAMVHERYTHQLATTSRHAHMDHPSSRDPGGNFPVAKSGRVGTPPEPHAPARPMAEREGQYRRQGDTEGGMNYRAGGRDGARGGGTPRARLGPGVGDWRQLLLEQLEQELVLGKSRGKVEVHSEEGVYMSWRVVVALAGCVSAVLACVAYIAYKHGADAMANITRRAATGAALVAQERRPGSQRRASGGTDSKEVTVVGRQGNGAAAVAQGYGHEGEGSNGENGRGMGQLGVSRSSGASSGRDSPPPEPWLTHKWLSDPIRPHPVNVEAGAEARAGEGGGGGSGVADGQDLTRGNSNTRGSPPLAVKPQQRTYPGSPGGFIKRAHSLPMLEMSSGGDGGHSTNGGTTWVGAAPGLMGVANGLYHGGYGPGGRVSPDVGQGALYSTGGGGGGVVGNGGEEDSDPTRRSVGHHPGPDLYSVVERSGISGGEGVGGGGGGEGEGGEDCLDSSTRHGRLLNEGKAGSNGGKGGSARGSEEPQEGWPQSTSSKGRKLSLGSMPRNPGGGSSSGQGGEDNRGGGGGKGQGQGGDGGAGAGGVMTVATLKLLAGRDGEEQDVPLVKNRLRTEFVEGQKLGKGGFGTVFRCQNRLDGHDYAIKKIRLSSERRWQAQLSKVMREVKILALLDHPNIVRYYQAWLEKIDDEELESLAKE
ncbi:unnamed protein product, partial [Discosporangium mesarthrocarpum]